MKKCKALPAFLTVTALLIGLFLPFFTAAGQDYALHLSSWSLTEDNAHYAYQGTLMNRVVALDAHLNASPAVIRRDCEPDIVSSRLIDDLSAFLPVSGAQQTNISAFLLSPKQYSSEYRYMTIMYALNEGSLTVTLDSDTQLPLRMELSMPSEVLSQWLSDRSLWDILHKYAALLDLGEPTDDESSISTLIRSQSAQLRGTAYKMTVTTIPSAGSLLLKLTASTPA